MVNLVVNAATPCPLADVTIETRMTRACTPAALDVLSRALRHVSVTRHRGGMDAATSATSSSRSSRPRSTAREPAWACRRCTASCSRAAEPSSRQPPGDGTSLRVYLPRVSADLVAGDCRRRPDPRSCRDSRRCSSPKTSRSSASWPSRPCEGLGYSVLGGLGRRRGLPHRDRAHRPDSHPADRRRDARAWTAWMLAERISALRPGAQSDLHLRLYRRCGWRASRDRSRVRPYLPKPFTPAVAVREGPRGRWPG